MSEYLKEAERLARVLADIAQTALRGVEHEQIRGHLMDAAALLARIQHGAVPKTQWATCPETGTPCSLCPTNRTQCHALATPAEVPSQHAGARMGTEEGGEAYTAGYTDGEAAGYVKGLAEANRYRHLRALIVSDSYAITFQSLAQYRTALLKSIDEPWETAQHAPRREVK